MGIIKTGLEVSRTIKNVGRTREIVVIFAKHGFAEFFDHSLLSIIPDFALPKSKKNIKEELDREPVSKWPRLIGSRLRSCFEELGPSFIKLGQLLSSREELFSNEFLLELKQLKHSVQAPAFEQISKYVEEQLGASIGSIFSKVDSQAIGAASIGFVYQAQLLNGDDVVIKVKRPNIERIVKTDLDIMIFLASGMEKISEELRNFGIMRLLQEFRATLLLELDFNLEISNKKKLEYGLNKVDKNQTFYLPKIYEQYSCESVLVMEKIKGSLFSDVTSVKQRLEANEEILINAVQIVVKLILEEGLFHADLHGGNFFLLDDNRIALIDFGLIGNLGRRSRINIIAIFYSLLTSNYETLAYELLDVAEYESIPNVVTLSRELKQEISPYIGLGSTQIDFNKVLLQIVNTLAKHKLLLPRDWYIAFRAFVTLEGVGRSLDQNVDIFAILEREIKSIYRLVINKDHIAEDSIWMARDLFSILKIVPRHIKWFLNDFSRNNYALELRHSGFQSQISALANSVVFLGYTILVAMFVLAGILTLDKVQFGSIGKLPLISVILWVMATILFVKAIRQLKRD